MRVACTQCGAAVEVAADARILECPFCSTSLAVDATGTVFHEVMLTTVEAAEAVSHLRRFLAGRHTVAGLAEAARISSPRLELFPFWAFTVSAPGGERVVLQPAAPSVLQGLQGVSLPAGTTRPMSAEAAGGAPVIEPEIPVATAREWLAQQQGDHPVVRTVLYHLPLYRIDYEYRGRTYRAAVDGVSGQVFPGDYPAKAETPYLAMAVVAIVLFGIEGLLVQNLFLKATLYLATAPPLLGLAWLTSRTV